MDRISDLTLHGDNSNVGQQVNIMKSVSVHEAKARFSELIGAVEKRGESVIVSRYGHPVVELRPLRSARRTTKHPLLSRVVMRGDLTAPTEAEWTDV